MNSTLKITVACPGGVHQGTVPIPLVFIIYTFRAGHCFQCFYGF